MDVNTSLIILSLTTLVSVVCHGIWSNRQNKSNIFGEQSVKQPTPVSVQVEIIKDDISSNNKETLSDTYKNENELQTTNPSTLESQQANSEENNSQQIKNTELVEENAKESGEIKISLRDRGVYSLTVEEIEKSLKSKEGFEIFSPVLREQLSQKVMQREISKMENSISSNENKDEEAEKVENKLPPLNKQEEKVDSVEVVEKNVEKEQEEEKSKENVLLLYIVAPEKQDFYGENLHQALEKEGFLFGDKQIFHRHSEFTQQSPVLFSLANLENGGVFPDDNQDYQTFGLVLFMELPVVYGTPQTNLCLMLNTAKSLVKTLNATLLTDTQAPFDEKAEQDYRQRVSTETN